MSSSIVQALRRAGIQEVIAPADQGFDGARRVWNGAIDRRPAVVVRCGDVEEVVKAVQVGRDSGLPLAIRGGAHSAAGFSTCDGGVVIDLGRMKGIQVDPERRVATAGPGVLWRELDRETQRFDLATPGGIVSNTGIAGLTLGGGLGWLMGSHGLTADNLLGVELVTAEGQVIRVDSDSHQDLFWALRGGGGNFGVVTRFDYQLHPHGPTVLGGLVVWPIAEGREVLEHYREYSAALPDEAEAFAAVLTVPEVGPAVAIITGYNGDPAEGAKVCAAAAAVGHPVANTIGPMTHVDRQAMLDSGNAEHGPRRYWKSGYGDTLSDEMIRYLLEAGRSFPSIECSMLVMRIHGAATRIPGDETAFALRGEKWDLSLIAQWREAEQSARHLAWTRQWWGAVEPLTSGMAYINHLAGDDGRERARRSFGDNYQRLAIIKGRYDPDNMWHLNPNIIPTRQV